MKDKFIIHKDYSIKQALEQLSGLAINGPVLFVVDYQDKIEGSISDGDIRRGLLDGKDLELLLVKLLRKIFNYITNSRIRLKVQRTKKGINIVYLFTK